MRYVPEFDGLRAIAIILVILYHAAPDGVLRGGYIGVDLFFVLSAFLITSILAAEWHETGRLDLKKFYWRRFLRLMPALLLFLTVYVVAAPFIWLGYNHGRDALIAGLYLSDYAYALWEIPHYISHTWSLAVEEHFYLLWPLLLVPLLKAQRPLIWLTIAFCVLTLWRTSYAADPWQAYTRFDTHATGLVLGAALYFSGLRFGRVAAVFALAAIAAVAIFANLWWAFGVITIAEVASAVLIASRPPLLNHPVLVWIGKRSYAIYLWQSPVEYLLRGHLPFLPRALATLVIAGCIALVSWHTVEAWGRRMKPAVPALRRRQAFDHAG